MKKLLYCIVLGLLLSACATIPQKDPFVSMAGFVTKYHNGVPPKNLLFVNVVSSSSPITNLISLAMTKMATSNSEKQISELLNVSNVKFAIVGNSKILNAATLKAAL